MRQLATTRADFEAELPAPAALVGRDRRGDRAARGRDPGRRARARRRGGARVHRALRRRCTADVDGRAGARRATSCERRFDAITPAQRDALQAAARARAQLPRAPARGLRPQLELPRRRRHAAGPEGHAAGPRRHLRAGRQGGLSVERADERHAGAGGRRRRDRDGGADAAAARRNALVLAAAHVAGVHRVVHDRRRAGGGALAYGTATIPRVDKITGPGNAYVASAKRRVFGQVGIDMIAGPERDPGAGRRQHAAPTGWRWTCSARPSTTNWRRASCCAPTPPTSTRCSAAIDRLLPAHAARATSSAPRSKAAAR